MEGSAAAAAEQPLKRLRGAASSSEVVFSPRRRLRADGAAHDAALEVRAFLRHRGFPEDEIGGIMANGAGATPTLRVAPAAPRQQPRQFFADQARAMGAGRCYGDSTGADDFAADLLEVLAVPAAADASANPIPSALAHIYGSGLVGNGGTMWRDAAMQPSPPGLGHDCTAGQKLAVAHTMNSPSTPSVLSQVEASSHASSVGSLFGTRASACSNLFDEDSEDELLFMAARKVEERLVHRRPVHRPSQEPGHPAS